MKKFLIIIQIFLLFAGCTEKDEGITKYTIQDYRLFIKDNRIIEKNYLYNDTVKARTKYYFTHTQVKVVSYGQDTTIQESYILYNIGKNGYAESSIEYPESIMVVGLDSVYTERRHYTYNSLNQLIKVECEHYHPNNGSMSTLFTYTYDGENISGCSSYYPYSNCHSHITYELSYIPSKIDILNFTNGILGKTNTKLVKHILKELSGDCDPHSPTTIEYDITYTLDDQGYVIQSSESTKDVGDVRYPTGNTYVTINNYDIRFLD
ncbi:MAG: hypothetical protein JXB24_08910 [Bacteroidales bacterium]|nr:hypothetical protein [Bacteroidales bacterium]